MTEPYKLKLKVERFEVLGSEVINQKWKYIKNRLPRKLKKKLKKLKLK